MKFFQRIHHPAFLSEMDYLHDIFHGVKWVALFEEMLGEPGFMAHVLEIMFVFPKSY